MLCRRIVVALMVATFAILLVGCSNPPIDTSEDLSRIAGWRGKAPRSVNAFNFIVFSDRTGGHAPGEWAAAVREANLLNPDFVICVGDLIEGGTDDRAVLKKEWDEFDALTRELDAPFFYCAGNHDVTNDVMLEMYVDRHGVDSRSYYSFDYRRCHFVVLDSWTAFHSEAFAEAQFRWLEKDLAASKDAEHVFLFYHHLHFHHDVHFPDYRLWTELRKLVPPKKTTIFNGDQHEMLYFERDGIESYVLGATASVHYNRERGGFLMFGHVAVDAGKATIAVVPLHKVVPAPGG